MSIGVLFVCLGNICRSPTAEAVFRKRLQDHPWLKDYVHVDSAGTGAWHVGDPPDPRSIAAGAARGFDLSSLRARQTRILDFDQFDYILAMDHSNLSHLKQLAPSTFRGKIDLFLNYSSSEVSEVPDPYYQAGDKGFYQVIDLIEEASEGLINVLEARLSP